MAFTPPEQIWQKLQTAPKKPGVYIYRDDTGKVIYVGKAVNLHSRTRSYFLNFKRLEPRIQNMVELASDIEYLVVGNEVEALILETNLIKKYDPKYNVMMTDGKNYLWIKILSQLDFPIVRIVREKKDDGADYFGPFPDKRPVKRMLKQLRKVFPYRTCSRVIEIRKGKVYSSDPKPCLYKDLGLCVAPCDTNMSKSEYRKIINDLKRFLRSEHKDLKKQFSDEMKVASSEKNYEKAATIRDQLRDLEYITRFSLITEKIDDVSLSEKEGSIYVKGVEDLVKFLKYPEIEDIEDHRNFRIECYDISNIQGTNATSSMVVAVGGRLKKSDYRKFKIKSKDTPDDFAMLQETLDRRVKYLLPDNKKTDSSFISIPDLIVIDGGKGQLSSVLKIMRQYQYDYGIAIPVIGLAKKREEVFVPEYDNEGNLKFRLVRISRRSYALRILQQVRDEAHRFGLGYHRLLRSKEMTYSQLDLIPGVGDVTRKRLILAFGSVDGVKKAKIEEIEAIVKNHKTAYNIKKLLV